MPAHMENNLQGWKLFKNTSNQYEKCHVKSNRKSLCYKDRFMVNLVFFNQSKKSCCGPSLKDSKNTVVKR